MTPARAAVLERVAAGVLALPSIGTVRVGIDGVDAELNESPTLDTGDPVELGRAYAALKRRLPRLNVMGGCCGTDHRHVEQIAAACAPLFA